MVAAPLRAAAAVTLPADRAILSALVDLAAALEEDGAPAMIIGGIAVIVRGVPRQTVDVDATVWAEGTSIERLSATLARHGIVGRIPDALEFARKRHVLLLRHATATGRTSSAFSCSTGPGWISIASGASCVSSARRSRARNGSRSSKRSSAGRRPTESRGTPTATR